MGKVAIITRTKNRGLLLERAIQSVLSQAYENWIHVIVNDGGVAAEVDDLINKYRYKYNEKLIVVHNPISMGMEAASNIGIKSVESMYVVVHDDDDSWDVGFLENCVDELVNNVVPSVKGVVTHAKTIREKIEGGKVILLNSHSFDPWLNSITLPALSEVNKFMPISFLYERAALDVIGFYDEDLPVIGDWDFNLRFLMKFDVKIIKKELANYHIREHTKTDSYNNTVTSGKNLHDFYRSVVINKYLRSDFNNGSPGLGHLLMHGDYAYRHGSGIWRINQAIDSAKKSRFFALIRKWFMR